MTVIGTEIASAHGDAATSTTSARWTHKPGSPRIAPTTAIATAVMITPGTSGRAMRSASRCRWPLLAWASATIVTTRASELSAVVAVASISSAPLPLIDPANTWMPGRISTGRDSPVMADMSSVLRPTRMIPSVATRPPGRTMRMSPTRSTAAGISCSTLSRRTVAVSGSRVSSERSPRWARASENSSSPSLIENKKASIAASRNSPSASAPNPAMVIRVPTPIRLRRNARSVPGTNVQPPMMAAPIATMSDARSLLFQARMKLVSSSSPAAAAQRSSVTSHRCSGASSVSSPSPGWWWSAQQALIVGSVG